MRPVHVVFIVQLPKVVGGCQNFVGFQGGKWRSVHIDELFRSNEQLPRIDYLVNRSVSELLEPIESTRSEADFAEMEVDPPGNNLTGISSGQNVNPTRILRNCLQSAAARLYDDSTNVNRGTRRIEILLGLLPEDEASYETGKSLFIS